MFVEDPRKVTYKTLPTEFKEGADKIYVEVLEGEFDTYPTEDSNVVRTLTPYRVLEEANKGDQETKEKVVIIFLNGNVERNF